MPTQREMLASIVQKAQEDKQFFNSLLVEPEKALASIEGLDETTKTKLKAISPSNFLVPALVRAIGVNLKTCEPTCFDSCTGTCGELSCDVTCGPENRSCGLTCNASCGQTLAIGRF